MAHASADPPAPLSPEPRFDLGARPPAPPSDTLPAAAVAGIALLCAFGGISVAIASVDALVLGIAVIACLVIAYDFRFGVVLLILVLPVSQSEIFPHEIFGITGLNPMNLLIVGTALSCLFHMSTDRRLPATMPAHLLWLYVIPFVAAGVLGMRHFYEIAPAFFLNGELKFSAPSGYLRDLVIKPLFLVLFAVLVAAAVVRTRRPERLLMPMIASTWVMSLMAIAYFLMSDATLEALSSEYARQFFTPLGIHANELGRLYAVAYALLLFTWSESKDTRLSFLLLATIAVLMVALVLTFSRGAFLGFLIVSLVYLAWRASAKTFAFALLAAAFLAVLLPGAVFMRAQMGLGGADLNTLSAGRLTHIWMPLQSDLYKSPIWGNGVSSILWSDAMRSPHMFRVIHPHNAYLEAFLDMGIIGLTLLCAYFVRVWRGFRKLASDPAQSPELRGFFQGAAAAIVALAVVNVAGSSLYPVVAQTFLWMAIGMMYGLRLRQPAR